MKDAMEILLWFFLGCILVLMITHSDKFATAVTAVGGQVNGMSAALAGES
jgi:hypothetical protein